MKINMHHQPRKPSRDSLMSPNIRILLTGALQFLLGALLSAGICWLYHFSFAHPIAIESWVENIQETFLLICAALFACAARRNPRLAGGLWLISGFCASLFIRELDALFDLITHGFWKYVLIVFLCLFSTLVARAGRDTILPGLADFVSSRSFMLMLPGVVIILVYSRLYGFKGLWEHFSACSNWGSFKSFSEEATELLGYALMLSSALHYAFGRVWRRIRALDPADVSDERGA